MTDKALEAASKALVKKYREYWPGSWPAKPEADGLSKAAIDTYLSTLTGEHGELVERLRNPTGDEKFDYETCTEAATTLSALSARPSVNETLERAAKVAEAHAISAEKRDGSYWSGAHDAETIAAAIRQMKEPE